MKFNQIRKSLALGTFIIVSQIVFSQNVFYAVSAEDDSLRLIDVSSTTLYSTIAITLSGDVVSAANGIAEHPTTGVVYAILQVNSSPTRVLVTLDMSTGVATLVGDTGDNFAGIAFNNSGLLYGVTGDGAAVSETLYTLNTLTGASTFVMALGNSNDGETIAINPDNNLLYHASGFTDSIIVESVIPPTSTNNIALSGDVYSEATAMAYSGGGSFVVASWTTYYSMTLAGVITVFDTIGFNFNCKGLVAGTAPVGLSEVDNQTNGQFLYPNPAGDFVFLKNEALINEPYAIFNMNGAIVQTGLVSNEMNISELSPGNYIFKLRGEVNLQIKLVKK